MKSAYVLIDSCGSEIRYRSGVTASDPFLYVDFDGGGSTVYFDAREYEAQKKKLDTMQNGVTIERLEQYGKKYHAKEDDPLVAALLDITEQQHITALRISGSMPYAVGKKLKDAGLTLLVHDFAEERQCKTPQEIHCMIEAQRVNESAFKLARDILTDSEIVRDSIMYDGAVLTSERMKRILKKHLLGHGYVCPEGIIVSSGEQTARPHDEGSGALKPHQSIIIDIFPRSEETGYFADMTRTFVKGNVPQKIQELYDAVKSVQHEVLNRVAVGDVCANVHRIAVDMFKNMGYDVSPEQGFMHGTGHSLGLDIHENPRINANCKMVLQPGMTCTIEPGLYYPGVGGVRLEDVVVFHPDGRKENITTFNHPYRIP